MTFKTINYKKLDEVDTTHFLSIFNHPNNRTHLIDHPLFDRITLAQWITDKMALNAVKGCKIRAVVIDNCLIGWCGIQQEGADYELALVIDHSYWGTGKSIFNDMMCWAKQLGHKEVVIQLLNSRREYTFLRNMARITCQSEWQGNVFTRYYLPVR